MRIARGALLYLGVALPLLSGCGSTASPPLTLSCSQRHLAAGDIRAGVTVTNTTSSPVRGIVYGPAILLLRHISPVLNTAEVVVAVNQGRAAYSGYVIPRISPKHPFHLIMRFARPDRARGVLVSATGTVHASNWQILHNANCMVR